MRSHRGAALVAFVVAATPLFAHHTASYIYDVDKPVTLRGIVTEVEWKNPHVIVHVDAKDAAGGVVNWSVEARAVYIMRRQGMDLGFMKTGDAVDLMVCVAKDGSHQAAMRSFKAPDGTKRVDQC